MKPNTNHIIGLLIAFIIAYFTYIQVAQFTHLPYIFAFALVALGISLFTIR